MNKIKGVITEEWRKVDKRPIAYNRFFDSIPTVDASVMRLARNITLPLEDAVSFRDVLDHRIDSDLKKVYQATGGACKPAVAWYSISRTTRLWSDNIETALRRGLGADEIIKALDDLKLAMVGGPIFKTVLMSHPI